MTKENKTENYEEVKVATNANDDNTNVKNSEDFQDKYLRCLAELENTRKQTFKQLEDARDYSITRFAKELLSVMDVFTKAMESIEYNKIVDAQFKNFVEGIDLTKQELNKIFNKFGIKPIGDNLVNSKVDPNFHEILLTKEDASKENGTIFQVFEQGYTLGDRLLRAAKVGVIKK